MTIQRLARDLFWPSTKRAQREERGEGQDVPGQRLPAAQSMIATVPSVPTLRALSAERFPQSHSEVKMS